MAYIQSLANQLGWSITTQDYLNNLNSEFRYVANKYLSTVDNFKQANGMEHIQQNMQLMSDEFNREIDDLKKHIDSEHLAYIEAQSKIIADALNSVLKIPVTNNN